MLTTIFFNKESIESLGLLPFVVLVFIGINIAVG